MANRQWNNTKVFACLPASSKTRLPKQGHLGTKFVSLLGINFDDFFSAKLYQQQISYLHVVMKKIENFPEKFELPKVILRAKINSIIFSAVFWGWNEKFAKIRADSLSHLAALLLDCMLMHVLQHEPAFRLSLSPCQHFLPFRYSSIRITVNSNTLNKLWLFLVNNNCL